MAIIGTLPQNIQNGTVEDATQVMANFNWILNQVNANAAQLSLTPQLNALNTFTQPITSANAITGAQLPTSSQVQNNLGYAVDTGTSNNYVIAPSITYTALSEGQEVFFRAITANTGASTLTLNGLTAISLTNPDGTALSSSQIAVGTIYRAIYNANSTRFELAFSGPNVDANPLLKNSTDPTKQVNFNLGSLTTATTRTITIQDKNLILAGLSDIVIPRGFIAGATLSTSGASSTMTISSGQATDSTNSVAINLAASIGKTTANWTVGTGNGGLDTGAIANSTWYYFYLIRRPDTGVVDVIFSLSSFSPTLPTNYTQYRYIGAGFTNGSGQWTGFTQVGDEFTWSTPILDFSAIGSTTAVTLTCSVPRGRKVKLLASVYTGQIAVYLSDLSNSDLAPSNTVVPLSTAYSNGVAGQITIYPASVWTNTSAQIRYRNDSAVNTWRLATNGWVDLRDRSL